SHSYGRNIPPILDSNHLLSLRPFAKELGKGFTGIMANTIKLTVNGKAVALKVDDLSMPLLYALRDQLGLHGMHFGCGLSQCGACTVHYYGEALRSCVMPV